MTEPKRRSAAYRPVRRFSADDVENRRLRWERLQIADEMGGRPRDCRVIKHAPRLSVAQQVLLDQAMTTKRLIDDLDRRLASEKKPSARTRAERTTLVSQYGRAMDRLRARTK